MTNPPSPAPEPVFVDTSAWYAHLNRSDVHHRDAVSRLTGLDRNRLVTTMQVAEECSRLASRYQSEIAVQFTWHLWRGDFARVINPGPDVQSFAWQVFRSARRGGLSFTDCISLAYVRLYHVSHVVAYGIMLDFLDSDGGGTDALTAG
jgi:predicted nucleic acid-binding protein